MVFPRERGPDTFPNVVDIRELARRSGVSQATVSRALNDRTEVSTETRRRILELAEELGYTPNQPARTLVRRRSDMIGLLWDTGYANEGRRPAFLLDLFVGIKQALTAGGFHLMVLSVADTAGVDAYLRAARQHSLDGVIMMGVDEGHPAITALVDSGIACVGIDLPLQRKRTTYVTSDNRSGAASAVRHLHSLGHRAIATITGPLPAMPAAERLAGYRYEMARVGLDPHPEYIEHGDFYLSSGYECAQRLIALPEPPTAIFAAGDEMAIGAMQALHDAGISVPADVAVVGFDDIEAASLVRPALTTVAQDRVSIGVGAVETLLTAIGSPDDDTRDAKRDTHPTAAAPLLIPTQLIVRGSCGSVR
ncbi:transcriptional regulator, LacI family [Catenulispora acidiphila DSM 44928]|uniref:Transcriptional regulator, LacI family n=1 Tax=Catenulispora acidiphila (strain DSM 44928 / JCM 14897 / NBRC 102108 / NRRL B-24433 / ID139908) TaxID=479433 RepID=C7Q003_CATAD|nr:LacI family DNA-binding transcriptional regulator [Catenulispora acidiphila]ACU75496.1 transcriptional regulator, LacI family [Catenulispora acidiphila DSM 44928]